MENKLAAWLETYPKPMKKIEFAEKLGVAPSYVSYLCKTSVPLISMKTALKIAEITKGAVTPNDLAGYSAQKSKRA